MRSNINIAQVEIERFAFPLARPITSSRGSWQRREGWLLRVRDRNGQVGLGEAAPLPGYSPDTLVGCRHALERCASWLEGWSTPAPAPPSAIAAAVASAVPDGVPAARFAVETALFDLIGQVEGKPISALLGAGTPAARVPLCALLPAGADAASAARAALARGVRSVKLKVGFPGALEREVSALERIRAEVGDAMSVRVDANGAWTPAEASRALAAFGRCEVEYVEEPVPARILAELVPAPAPVAVDESLAAALAAGQSSQRPNWSGELDRLLALPGVAAAVLKPALLGGLTAALAIADAARARGIDAVVSHMLDGPVGFAAAAELALAVAGTRAAGLGPHSGLADRAEQLVPHIRGGALAGSPYPGLGLSDEARAELTSPRRSTT